MPASIVSEEELKKAQAHFSIYDRTGDGTISVNDIGNVIRSLNRNPLNSEVFVVNTIILFINDFKLTLPDLL
jgi:Ca2+-binding EF-hand superfamily protein